MEPSPVSGTDLARTALCREPIVVKENGEKMCDSTCATADPEIISRRLEMKNNELLQHLQRPFVVKRGEVCSADWLDSVSLARAESVPGKFWLYMGVEVAGEKYLQREEVVLLCDMGYLLLREDGCAMSMQQVYGRLLRHCPCLERQYRAYAHLTRLGYRLRVRRSSCVTDGQSQSGTSETVKRHRSTEYSKTVRLDQVLFGDEVSGVAKKPRVANTELVSPEDRRESQADDFSTKQSVLPSPSQASNCCTVWYSLNSFMMPFSAASALDCRQCCQSAEDTISAASPAGNVTGLSRDLFSDWPLPVGLAAARDGRGRLAVRFLRHFGLSPLSPSDGDRVRVVAAPCSLFPPGVLVSRQCFVRLSALSVRDRGAANSCAPPLFPPAHPESTNWTKYKAQVRTLHSGAPLMSRLRVAPPAGRVQNSWSGWLRRRVLYDVFSPRQHYRKSQPPAPCSRLAVVHADSCLGEEEQVCHCISRGWCEPPDDGVSVSVAVVPSAAAPAIYTVDAGTLPVNSALSVGEDILLSCCAAHSAQQ